MTDHHGKFVWYELMASDPAASEAFYKSVIGWGARDGGVADVPYTVFTAGDAGVGGIWPITAEARSMGVKPGWVGYIQVDDIAASAAAVAVEGGKIYHGPESIAGVGQFAVAVDPQNAKFMLFQPLTPMAPAQNAPGHAGWHELYADDMASDFEFYANLFGWTKTEALEMGPMGTYQMFATGGEHSVGGMMNKPAQLPAGWLFYFHVEAVDAAVERLTTAGGKLAHGPQQVPGGLWIAQAVDPDGAMFAVVAPVR